MYPNAIENLPRGLTGAQIKSEYTEPINDQRDRSPVTTLELDIINKLGLHARAAAKLVKLSSSFESNIDIEKDGQRVNSKSIMGVMMLAASCGSRVTLHASGSDENQALAAVSDLINRRFDEEE